MIRNICSATAAFLLLTIAVEAQSIRTLEDLATLGTTVYVVDTSGEETKGRIVGLTDLALTLKFDDTRQQFALADVARVERRKRDSVRNGVLIGAVGGALAGFTLGKSQDSPACPRRGPECGQGALIGATGGAFWGAISGWIADALVHTRESVYVARP